MVNDIDHKRCTYCYRSKIFSLILIGFFLTICIPISAFETSEDFAGAENNSRSSTINSIPSIEYAIITPSEFTQALKPLADWKNKKGVFTKIYELEDIYNSYSGRDDAEKIRDFIAELDSTNSDNSGALKWVLLVGDSEILPVRSLYAGAGQFDFDDLYPSDYYYAALDSTWDTDNDGIFGENGEEDWEANVYVGRLPVNTRAEVSIVVDKILNYEIHPPEGDWTSRALFWGGLMDPPNNLTKYEKYKDNAYKVKRNARRFVPDSIILDEFYDYSQLEGGNYTLDNDTLNQSSAVSELNRGCALVNFAGQARYTGDFMGQYESESGLYFTFKPLYNYSNARNAKNGYRLPLIFLASCNSINFTESDDTNMEALITAPEGGAIGVISSTGISYRGETEDGASYGNWWLDTHFWRQFFEEGHYRPGEALYSLKEEYYQDVYQNVPVEPTDVFRTLVKTNLLGYNLLGDPEIPIRTSVPDSFKINNSNVYIGTKEITIQVNDSSNHPVEGAKVCLRYRGSSGSPIARSTELVTPIYFVAATGKDGIAELRVNLSCQGILDITITAHNFIPYEDSINVAVEPPDLILSSEDISVSVLSEGDNGTIRVRIHNDGGTAARSVDVAFFAVLESIAKIGNIGNARNAENAGNIAKIGKVQLSEVPAHGTKSASIIWPVHSYGIYKIKIIVDPDNRITETNERNNQASSDIYVNALPKLSAVPNFNLTEDTRMLKAVDLTKYVSDADNDTSELRFFIHAPDAINCAVFIDNANWLNIIPAPNWFGKCEVTIEVTDGLASTFYTFTVAVTPEEDAPYLEPIGDMTAIEDELYMYQVSAADADPSDVLLFSDDTALFEINASTGLISFAPTQDAVDNSPYTINISVTDGTYIDFEVITFTIHNREDPPVLTPIPKQEATVGKRFKYTVVGADEDHGANGANGNNGVLTFSDDTELFDIDAVTGIISFTPQPNNVGVYKINITVTDGNLTDSETMILVIHPVKCTSTFGLIAIFSVLIIIIAIILIILILPGLIRKHQSKY